MSERRIAFIAAIGAVVVFGAGIVHQAYREQESLEQRQAAAREAIAQAERATQGVTEEWIAQLAEEEGEPISGVSWRWLQEQESKKPIPPGIRNFDTIAQDEGPPPRVGPDPEAPRHMPLKGWRPYTTIEQVDRYIRTQYLFDLDYKRKAAQSIVQLKGEIADLRQRVEKLEEEAR